MGREIEVTQGDALLAKLFPANEAEAIRETLAGPIEHVPGFTVGDRSTGVRDIARRWRAHKPGDRNRTGLLVLRVNEADSSAVVVTSAITGEAKHGAPLPLPIPEKHLAALSAVGLPIHKEPAEVHAYMQANRLIILSVTDAPSFKACKAAGEAWGPHVEKHNLRSTDTIDVGPDWAVSHGSKEVYSTDGEGEVGKGCPLMHLQMHAMMTHGGDLDAAWECFTRGHDEDDEDDE